MIVDKDRPWTWVKYRDGMCNLCSGSCCTMPVEICAADLIRLQVCTEDELLQSKKKTVKRLIKAGILRSYREGTDLFMIESSPTGECYFLDHKTRLCKVYDLRPGTCRSFPEIGPRPSYCPMSKSNRVPSPNPQVKR